VRRILLALAAPALAIAFALTVSSTVLGLSGKNPLTIYGSMIDYGTQLNSIISTFNRAVPYYIAGLAVAVGFKMNLFNIGVEGQYYLAALLAAAAGAVIHLPAPLHVACILIVAMAVGAAWAGIAALLRVKRGVSEVISTIMLNNIVLLGLGAYLLNQLRATNVKGDLELKTKAIPKSGLFPSLNPVLEKVFGLDVPSGSHLTGFVVVALVLGIVFYLLVWRSGFGYDLRASGLNPWAAAASGVDPGGMVLKAMLLSGALAGLVGMAPLLSEFGQFTGDFPLGLGFTGIAVALIGRNHPAGIAFGALLWGFMERSAQRLDLEDVPKEIVVIMQGTIVLSVVIAYELVRRANLAREQRTVGEQVAAIEADLA
jgi:simple sugar transport system permease protein